MGAEAVKVLLSEIELSKLNKELEEAMGNTKSKQIRKKLAKRLKLVQGFASSHAPSGLDGARSAPGHPAGSASARSARRRPVSRPPI